MASIIWAPESLTGRRYPATAVMQIADCCFSGVSLVRHLEARARYLSAEAYWTNVREEAVCIATARVAAIMVMAEVCLCLH
jgi:hypothetical protein